MIRVHGIIVLFLTLIFCMSAHAAVPQTMNYQGYLTSLDGTPVEGTVQVVFSLYASPTGTTALWTEMHNITVSSGRYTAILGAGNITPVPLPPSLFAKNESVYLGVKVGTDDEMTPRQRITSTGYTMSAEYAATAGNVNCTGCISSPKVEDGTISNTDISDSTKFVSIQNSAGTEQFSVTDGSAGLRFAGSGSSSVSFDAANHLVTISSTGGSGSGTVTSVGTGDGLTGGPITTSGTLSVNFGGTGSAATVSRSDHDHGASYVSASGGTITGALELTGTVKAASFTGDGSGLTKVKPKIVMSASKTVTSIDNCTNMTNAIVTITAPSSGTISVDVDFELQVADHASPSYPTPFSERGTVYIGSSATDCVGDTADPPSFIPFYYSSTSSYTWKGHLMRSFSVTAGTYSYYLNGSRTYSDDHKFNEAMMRAVFYPD